MVKTNINGIRKMIANNVRTIYKNRLIKFPYKKSLYTNKRLSVTKYVMFTIHLHFNKF